VIQLADGRLVVPVALHNKSNWNEPDWQGTVMCYLSDDYGQSWKKSHSELKAFDKQGNRLVAQEPGVVELKHGRLMMFCRSDAGCQLLSYSTDRGVTWSPLQKSDIISPRSPASIERIPQTGDLLMAWNDHARIDSSLQEKRSPLTVAVSQDEGKTWSYIKDLEKNPYGWFCYTAIEFLDNHVLMAYCAGDRRYEKGLSVTKLSTLPVSWLYTGE
jgi:sialidase-1